MPNTSLGRFGAELVGDDRHLRAAFRRSTQEAVVSARRMDTAYGRVNATAASALRSIKGLAGAAGIGSALSIGFLGAQGIRDALNLETSLNRIVTLVGIARQEVEKFREPISRIARETGIASTELGDALFFITSAGLKGQTAIDALEASAKGAAIGLGETKTVADAATSALNAYGEESLSAEKAVAILTATVREGKAEAESIAGAIGAVLPVASALGVRFDELGASIAAMTRLGTSADEAVTQLTAIMVTTLKPTQEASEALASVGLTAADLRDSLRDRGLLATLELLQKRFNNNTDAIAKVFGNVRALRGVLNLLGENAQETQRIFEALAKTTGEDLDQAFKKWADTAEGRIKTSLGDLEEQLTRLGVETLPAVASSLGVVTDAVVALKDAIDALNLEVRVPPLVDLVGALNRLDPEILKRLVDIGFLRAGPPPPPATFSPGAGRVGGSLVVPGGGSPHPSVGDDPPPSGGGGSRTAARENAYERAIALIRDRAAALDFEAASIGRSAYENERLAAMIELTRAAQEAGVELTPEVVRQNETLADAYARAAGELERLGREHRELQERMEALKGGMKEFLGGMVRDLRAGESAADALGNAFGRLADRLVDLALDQAINALLGSLFGGGLGGGRAVAGPPLNLLPRFAHGGISHRPAIFGEGPLPEAAVPLPDGRSIPVSIRAGAGVRNVVIEGSTIVVEGSADERTLRALRRELDRRDAKLKSCSPK